MIFNASGIPCECDSIRFIDGRIRFLSLYGPTTAVRANWAFLINGKHNSVDVFESRVYAPELYITIQTKIDGHNSHLIIIDEAATNRVNLYADSFIQIGPNVKDKFFPRFIRMIKTPIRREWRDFLWQAGLDKEVITPLSGWGIDAYRIMIRSSLEEVWHPIVKQAILNGDLK